MSVKMQELLVGISRQKQAGIATATAEANIIRLAKKGGGPAGVELVTENDAEYMGKGHTFATEQTNSHWNAAFSEDGDLSSARAAFVLGYAFGKSTPTGTTPNWIYTLDPLDGPVDLSAELPYFSVLEQMRPGANVVIDRLIVGCAINDFTIALSKGPGRANARLSYNAVGSGRLTEPSGYDMPAASTEKLLPASSLTLSINGVDYVTSKNFESLEFGWNNNIATDAGFYPGCGFQTVTSSAITVATETNIITCTAGTFDPVDNEPVIFGGTAVPAGLTAGQTYYVRDASADTCKVAATIGGTAVDITSTGTAPTITRQDGTSGAVRGRFEQGAAPALTLNFVARYTSTSTEWTKLKAGTPGTGLITLANGANDSLSITVQKLVFRAVAFTEADGFITASVQCLPMWHATNKVVQAIVRVSGADFESICQ